MKAGAVLFAGGYQYREAYFLVSFRPFILVSPLTSSSSSFALTSYFRAPVFMDGSRSKQLGPGRLLFSHQALFRCKHLGPDGYSWLLFSS